MTNAEFMREYVAQGKQNAQAIGDQCTREARISELDTLGALANHLHAGVGGAYRCLMCEALRKFRADMGGK